MIGTRTEALRQVSSDRVSGLAHFAVRVALANALLVLCSKVAILLPWTPVPLTLQTFGVLLIAVLFGARAGTLAALLYLVEGAAGLPVFQPFGTPAALRLFGPSGGYLLSFPVAAFMAGHLLERWVPREGTPRAGVREWLTILAALVPAAAVMLFCGWAWLAGHVGVATATRIGLLPFLPGEVFKVAAATTIAIALRPKR